MSERRAPVVLGSGAHVALCDLRAGRCVDERILPAPVHACAIDAEGTRLVVLDAAGALHTLAASMANWTARGWVVSLCRTALATGHDTGRLGGAAPAELEAILGDHGGRAADELARARKLEEDMTQRFSRWNRPGAPHVELARELRLSPLAISLLLLAAAPQIWGELARAYGLCATDRARPLIDELLLAHLLEADTNMHTNTAVLSTKEQPMPDHVRTLSRIEHTYAATRSRENRLAGMSACSYGRSRRAKRAPSR